MKSATIKIIVPVDRRLVVQVPEEIPAGPAEVVVRSVEAPSVERGTGADLLASGLFGIWMDRTDISSSLEFARELRRRAEQRPHG
jgi:hypothetical protein